MPTSAKLIAAICFALTAFIAASLFNTGEVGVIGLSDYMVIGASAIGAICGWFVLGDKAGYGGFDSVFKGITAAITSLMIICILFGLNKFAVGLTNGSFGHPMDAVVSWVRFSILLFTQTFNVPVWTVIILGGALSGRITGMVNARWS